MSFIHFLLLVAQHSGEAQHPVTGIHGAEKSPEEHWALFVWRNLAKVTNLHAASSAGVCAAVQRSGQQGRKKETTGGSTGGILRAVGNWSPLYFLVKWFRPRKQEMVDIYHEEEDSNQFFTGNLLSKMFFPVLAFCRSGNTVLDFRSFPDCTRGQFWPLSRAADLPAECLGRCIYHRSFALRQRAVAIYSFLLLGFTGHE